MQYSLKQFLHNHFRIKDLNDLKFFQGIEISRSKKGIFISERKYTLKIIKDGRYLEANGFFHKKVKLSNKRKLLKDP